MTDVYMSWKGAADIDGWNVHTDSTRGGLKSSAKFVKSDFETHGSLKNFRKFLQVEAVRDGVGIRSSAVIVPIVT